MHSELYWKFWRVYNKVNDWKVWRVFMKSPHDWTPLDKFVLRADFWWRQHDAAVLLAVYFLLCSLVGLGLWRLAGMSAG